MTKVNISKIGGAFCISCGIKRLLSTFNVKTAQDYLESLKLNWQQILQRLQNEASVTLEVVEDPLKQD